MLHDSSENKKSIHWRRHLITLIKFGISFAILAYLFNQAWKHEQFEKLAETPKHFGWLFLAVLAGLSACTIAFVRWFLLVRALGLPFKLMDAIRLGFLGHLFNLMSFGVLGGDAIKSVFVARHMKGKGAAESVATVFADRAIGLMAMFLFAGIAYLVTDFSKLQADNPQALAAIVFICQFALFGFFAGFAILFGLMIFPRWQKLWIVQKLIAIPKVGGIFAKLIAVLNIYRVRKGVLVTSFAMSLVSVTLFAVSIYSIARGISDTFPSLQSHLVIAPIAMVANAVPLPGGLGGMEFALDFLYRGFSQATLPSEHGFVVALGFRLILLSVAAIGVVVYLTKKREIDELS